MGALRDLRHDFGVEQRELAELLAVPLETLRMWDSGRRPTPARVLAQATTVLTNAKRQQELLPLAQLATELGVHVRTLQAAARTGRLAAQFGVRSVFGRPVRFSTRAAAAQFMALYYRCFSGQEICPLPLVTVPEDYDACLRRLRHQMRLSQAALAKRIGAANKAVVYQWESRKRRPSPVLWRRVIEVAAT